MHQITQFKCSSSRLAVVFARSIEARCLVQNEDVVGAAPTGDAPTTPEGSTMLLPTSVRLILEVWWNVTRPQWVKWLIPLDFPVAFKIYDMDKDGYISNGELFQVLKMMVGNNLKDAQLQQIVDKTIFHADTDGDGKISFEEFCGVSIECWEYDWSHGTILQRVYELINEILWKFSWL